MCVRVCMGCCVVSHNCQPEGLERPGKEVPVRDFLDRSACGRAYEGFLNCANGGGKTKPERGHTLSGAGPGLYKREESQMTPSTSK